MCTHSLQPAWAPEFDQRNLSKTRRPYAQKLYLHQVHPNDSLDTTTARIAHTRCKAAKELLHLRLFRSRLLRKSSCSLTVWGGQFVLSRSRVLVGIFDRVSSFRQRTEESYDE